MFNDFNLRPMLLVEKSKVVNDKNFIYEVKFDGYRAFIYVSKNYFKIISRNGKDITNLYPELEKIKEIVGNNKIIFDGEIIALDKGKPNFQLLQTRSHLKILTKEIQEKIPIYFMVFDIIYENKDITNLKLIERKKILNKYPDRDIFIKTIMYDDGKKLFRAIKKLNLEGIVAKEKSSLYIPNKRVDSWIKIKNIKDGEFYIHGYIFKKEKYSLLLGEKRKNGLYYVGKVSVGAKTDIMKKIKKFKQGKNCFENFKEEAIYIEPKMKVTVAFLEKTKDGKLRHPIIKEK